MPETRRRTSAIRVGVRRAAVVITTACTAIVAVNSVVGYPIYGNASDDVVSHVDAVVVLGGEHDGREGYGVTLARQGLASTVVLSNPYPAADLLMRRMCLRRNDTIKVICVRPEPSTTRGEAIMARRLAREHNWRKILVVSWRYHLPRARLLFRQCFAGTNISTAVKAVPRQYVVPSWYWEYIYLYQSAGIAKAFLAEHC